MKWIIPAICSLLAGVSIVALVSIVPELMPRQLIYFLFGAFVFYFISKIKVEKIIDVSGFLYYLLVGVLFLLLIVGSATRSTMRWIDLFAGFKIQPSQFAPLVISLYLAKLWPSIDLTSTKGLQKFILIVLIPAALVYFQPDFGTSLVIVASVFSILVISRVKTKQLVFLFGLGILFLIVSWFVLLKPYQKARITNFFSGQDQQEKNASYNARQALIAVGSGQFLGRGIGAGVQSHLRFLPERQTDFVFASIAEEWGFIGSFLIIILYFCLIGVLMMGVFQADKIQHQLILLVLLVNLTIQVVVNIGMNLGLLPITGLTLPLMSYGGSSILSFLISLSLAFSIINSKKSKISLSIK